MLGVPRKFCSFSPRVSRVTEFRLSLGGFLGRFQAGGGFNQGVNP